MKVLIAALALPLVEIALFVVVGRWIGVLPVLVLVIAAAVLGVVLMRSTGPATAARVQAAMQGRENPLAAVGSAAFRVVAGLLFVVPGFLSDALAILLLLPPVQAVLMARVAAHHRRSRGDAVHVTIEGQAVEVPPVAPPADGGWTRH